MPPQMPIIITRGNNVYGPHQFPEKLIPKFTLLASRGKDLPVHGDGSSVRSYLYVEDVASAFDCVLHKGITGEHVRWIHPLFPLPKQYDTRASTWLSSQEGTLMW